MKGVKLAQGTRSKNEVGCRTSSGEVQWVEEHGGHRVDWFKDDRSRQCGERRRKPTFTLASASPSTIGGEAKGGGSWVGEAKNRLGLGRR